MLCCVNARVSQSLLTCNTLHWVIVWHFVEQQSDQLKYKVVTSKNMLHENLSLKVAIWLK